MKYLKSGEKSLKRMVTNLKTYLKLFITADYTDDMTWHAHNALFKRIMCIDKYFWEKNLKSGEKSLKRMPNLQNAMKRTRFRICLTNETYKSLDSIWFFMWIIISFNMISDIQHSQELWRPLNINRRNIGCGGRAQNIAITELYALDGVSFMACIVLPHRSYYISLLPGLWNILD